MVTKQSIGKVAVTPKGAWSASVQYKHLDLVTYASNSFIAIQDSYNKVPNPYATTAYWQLVAAGGASAPALDSNGILYWPAASS